MKGTKRWHVALWVAIFQFVCSAVIGCTIAYTHGAELRGYATVAGVPALASAIFVALASMFPELIEAAPVKFPLTITLPLVFCCLLPVAAVLIATQQHSLVALQNTLSYAVMWKEPKNLLITYFVQVALLSAFSQISRLSVGP